MAASSSKASVIRFGVFELDLRSGELRKAGTRISIQEQPLQALADCTASRVIEDSPAIPHDG